MPIFLDLYLHLNELRDICDEGAFIYIFFVTFFYGL